MKRKMWWFTECLLTTTSTAHISTTIFKWLSVYIEIMKPFNFQTNITKAFYRGFQLYFFFRQPLKRNCSCFAKEIKWTPEPINARLYLSLQRVTVTRIISRKVCHIAKMDESLSSPRKLKEDLQRVNIGLTLRAQVYLAYVRSYES